MPTEERSPQKGFVLAVGLGAATLIGLPDQLQATESEFTLQPAKPATAVWMLSAPHTGARLCEVSASTPVRFVKRASHGPHHYAQVDVLKGSCAGQQGYVPWTTLAPEPQVK